MLCNYKAVPQQHNMITDKLTLWMAAQLEILPSNHPNSTIFDQTALGQNARFCETKWSQASQSDFNHIFLLPSKSLEASICHDLTFFHDGELGLQKSILLPQKWR